VTTLPPSPTPSPAPAAGTPGGDALAAARALVAALGERRSAGSNRPFPLAGDAVWVVESGFVDVFAVAGGAGGNVRRHVVRLEHGDPLVGLDAPPDAPPGAPPGAPPEGVQALLAVGSADAVVWRVGYDALRDAAERAGDAALLPAVAERWARRVWGGTLFERVPEPTADVPLRDARALRPGEVVGPAADDVAWVWVEPEGASGDAASGDAASGDAASPGAAHLVGRGGLPVEPRVPFPLARPGWLAAAAPCEVRRVPREALGRRVRDGLAALQRALQRGAALAAADAAAGDALRLTRRHAEDRSALASALAALSGVVGGRARADADERGTALERALGGEHDALVAAMRRVGRPLGLTITLPRSAAELAGGPVEAIARASRFRTRRVLLAGAWWEADAGPLLAFRQAGRQAGDATGHATGHATGDAAGGGARVPVALLPRAVGGYELWGADGRRERVTEEVNAQLDPQAYSFYRPFPNAALGVGDVLRFAVRGSGRDLALVAALGTVGGLLGMAVPLASQALFDVAVPSADRPLLLQLTVALVAIGVSAAAFELTRAMALLRVEGRMGAVTQAALWDRLLALPLGFFRSYTAGDLAVRAMSIDAIRQTLTGSITAGLIGVAFSVFNFGLMFSLSTTLAWRGAALIAFSLAVTLASAYVQLRAQRAIVELRARTSGTLLQFLTSITKLRAAAAEMRAFSIWAAGFAAQRREQYRVGVTRNLYATFNAVFPIVASVVIFAAVGMPGEGAQAAPGLAGAAGVPPVPPPLRTGEFIAFLSAFGACLSATLAAGSSLVSALAVVPMYEQARPILTATPEITAARRDPGALHGDVDVQRVVFRYRPDAPAVLRGVSFQVQRGEHVALVGPSGSGKSTLIRLLLGFESPESGAIYLDGQDIAGLDAHAVRRQIGVVLQNGRVSAGDIYTNIVGSSLATVEQAWEAAEMAGLADDVREMPMGMHTVIGEGAGTLSGGQRQRLMIARALVHRPRIILFDEATSALDNRTQAVVTESLARLHVTRIIVAHRVSTVMGADRILVLAGGEVVQSGTYDELLRAPGLFAELSRRQLA
jgi:ATP-binding cassette subfamily C protein